MHETLINESEARYTIESGGDYVLLSSEFYDISVGRYPGAKEECIQGNYSSDKVDLISKSKLKQIIQREVFDESNPYRPVA
jgi:hypothetical protein